jgi:hypothetical protein
MKFVTFVRRPAAQPQQQFQQWFSANYAPAIARLPCIRGCLVRDTQKLPGEAGDLEDTKGNHVPDGYDVVLETWFSSSEDFRREARPRERLLQEMSAEYISYRVTPRLQKDPRIAEAGPGGSRPELTAIFTFCWKPGLDAEKGAEYWKEHTAIALRVQPVMTKYEQNLVDEVMSWTSGERPADAYGDFSFRTVQDMLQKFSVMEEEIQDSTRWIGTYQPMYLSDARSFEPLDQT